MTKFRLRESQLNSLNEAYNDCITYLPDVFGAQRTWFVAHMRATFDGQRMVWKRVESLTCTYTSRQMAIDQGKAISKRRCIPWDPKVEAGDPVYESQR